MTGRIRTVKPEWLEDELLAAASDEARVLSVGLILLADDYGNGRASIATIAASVWRFQLERDDGASAPEVLAKASRAFRELLAMGFIGSWSEGGQRYFAIRNWVRHQKVDKPGKPLVPKPPADVFFDEVEDSRSPSEPVAKVSRVIRESLAPDLRPTTNDLDQRPTTPIRASAQVRPDPAPEPPKQIGGNSREISVGSGSTGQIPAEKALPEPAPEIAEKSPRKPPVSAPDRLPYNLEEALQMAICARADVAVAHPERAEWLQPQKWPEVVKVATALHEACGLGEVRMSVYGRDSGVRAIVELFAAGYMPSDLVKAARLLPSDPWWSKEGSRRGLASLSAEVVRRVLATGLSPAQEARVARALGERPPSALGSILPPIPAASGGDT